MDPRSIVAVILASVIILIPMGYIFLITIGHKPLVETKEMLLGLLQFIAGGLLAYIGHDKK